MKAATVRLSVLCPFCKTGFTFKKEENLQKFREGGSKAPLHGACKTASSKEK